MESTKAPDCGSSPHGAHGGPEDRGGCPHNDGERGSAAAQERSVGGRENEDCEIG
jgi:hypothetical protein